MLGMSFCREELDLCSLKIAVPKLQAHCLEMNGCRMHSPSALPPATRCLGPRSWLGSASFWGCLGYDCLLAGLSHEDANLCSDSCSPRSICVLLSVYRGCGFWSLGSNQPGLACQLSPYWLCQFEPVKLHYW